MFIRSALVASLLLLSACASLDARLAKYGAGAYQIDNTTTITKDGKVVMSETITERAHCDTGASVVAVAKQCHQDGIEVK